MSQFWNNLGQQVDHHNDANTYAEWWRIKLEDIVAKIKAASREQIPSSK